MYIIYLNTPAYALGGIGSGSNAAANDVDDDDNDDDDAKDDDDCDAVVMHCKCQHNGPFAIRELQPVMHAILPFLRTHLSPRPRGVTKFIISHLHKPTHSFYSVFNILYALTKVVK